MEVIPFPVAPRLNHVRSSMMKLSFDEVRTAVQAQASLNYPDVVVPLTRMTATIDGEITVPGVGKLKLTPWSKAQLARMLGIRWDRWFDSHIVMPDERAEEINLRLSRQAGEWKVRARRFGLADPESQADGVLRAFVGPRFEPLDDHRIFDRLAAVLGDKVARYRFNRIDITDRFSTYAAVSDEELDLGTGVSDPHRGGFLVRNSEVGAGALAILEYLYRLVCTNGLVAPVAGRQLFRRIHRRTTDASIEQDLNRSMAQLPERIGQGMNALRAARAERVVKPEETLKNLLAADPEVKPHTAAVLAAYAEEWEPTRFGLVQAITAAARRLEPDARLALEAFAGQLTATPLAAQAS